MSERVSAANVWRHGLLPVVGFAIALAGCSRPQQNFEYVSSAAVLELSELHQRQIRDVLTTFYGTPSNPTLKVPAEDGQSDDEDSEFALVDKFDPKRLAHGAAVYNKRCAGCHGITGDGAGEAAPFLNPKPRDYRKGVFKFTSTGYGNRPRPADLVRTIRRGAKGTSMPAFQWISDEDVSALVDYVIALSHRGQLEEFLVREAGDYDDDEEIDMAAAPEFADIIERQWEEASTNLVMPLTVEPPRTEKTEQAGWQAFQSLACAKCHGLDGKGQTEWLSPEFIAEVEARREQGEQVSINYDAWGNPAPAADLTSGMLHGGRRPVDIYRRIHSGINGTPMPGFGRELSAEPDKIWHLVHFVLALTEGKKFEPTPTQEPATTDTAEESAKDADTAESKPEDAPSKDVPSKSKSAATTPENEKPNEAPAKKDTPESKPEESKPEEPKPEEKESKPDGKKPSESKPTDEPDLDESNTSKPEEPKTPASDGDASDDGKPADKNDE